MTLTCGLDSICQVLVVGMMERPGFASELQKSVNIPFLDLVNRIFTQQKLSQDIYSMRATIMVAYFKKYNPKQINKVSVDKFIVSCNGNVNYILRDSLQEFVAFSLMKTACKNGHPEILKTFPAKAVIGDSLTDPVYLPNYVTDLLQKYPRRGYCDIKEGGLECRSPTFTSWTSTGMINFSHEETFETL